MNYLISWGFIASYLAFNNKSRVILIGKTEELYQLITDEEETPIETENFIRHFFSSNS